MCHPLCLNTCQGEGRGGGGLYRSVLTRPVAVRLWKHYGMPTCVLLGKLLNKDPWIKDTSLTWFCPILIQIRDTLKFHNRHLFLVHIPLVSSFLSPSPLFSSHLSSGPPTSLTGGNGYINEYPTGRFLRDAKLYEIGAGTSEIRRWVLGRAFNEMFEWHLYFTFFSVVRCVVFCAWIEFSMRMRVEAERAV